MSLELLNRMPLIDGFGRLVDYLRVSVTDRCNLRCTYCMREAMQFLPRKDLLSLEELDRLCTAFVHRGVKRLRLTGGEPLVRKGVMDLVRSLSRHLATGALEELTLSTNGVLLKDHAAGLAAAGVKRVNVSLDSLDRSGFARIARADHLYEVLEGIAAAQAAGLKVKINTVALKNDNAAEIPDLIAWAHARGIDITLIETMPIGEVDQDRTDQFVSLKDVRADLESFWTLTDLPDRTGGPARYVRVNETGGRLGFITPLSHNFCDACRRVRITCTGKLYMCVGHSASVDLREPLRASEGDGPLNAAIDAGLALKPKAHDFQLPVRGAAPAVSRHMSMTGG
ncbi:cyclic pyranopterin phosphate synthase [Rhizomicrobium electricum]|nr:GTP 3',8-cyclase MoaA [Rhizomicrobium electricum]NIJ49037.1 cyclic pyranopterin phosphate synthase [Rhizomicrobium electricum]